MRHEKQRSKRNQYWIIVFLLILFLGFPGAAMGAPSRIELEVFPGFDGAYKGDWVPVRVRISNPGEDIEGELVARTGHEPWPESENRLLAAEPVKLAGGTSKEVTLFLSGALATPETRIEFRTDDGVVAQKLLGGERVEDVEKLIGVLSDSPGLSSLLHRWVGTTDAPRTWVQLLKAEEIPEKDVGLSGLDVLVINGFDSASLGESRQAAIRRWVKRGGLLVVAGGPSLASAKDWESMLPVMVEGTSTLKDLKPFNRWGSVPDLESPFLVSSARLADGGQTVIAAGDLPLIARRPVGSGAVVFAAYDLTASPLAEWPGNERLWREMLILGGGEGSALQLGTPYSGRFAPLEQAVPQMPHLRLPSLPVMVALFLVYASVVGPITYWILSRLKRREWAWWIIPSLGIVVSLGVYAYGQIIRGGDVLVHNLAYVETDPSGEARIQGVSGFVSQEAGTYRLEGSPEMWMWPLSQGVQSRPDVKVSAQPSITFFEVPYWTMRKVYAETTKSLGGDLRAVARYRDGTLRGEVKNGTRLPLRNVTISMGNRIHRVGSLSPGETGRFEVDYVPDRDGRMEGDALPNPMMAAMQQPTREDLMRIGGSGVRVMGWTEEPVFSYEVQGHRTKAEHLALVLGRVEIKPLEKNGTLLWPDGTIPARPVGGENWMAPHVGHAVQEEFGDPVMLAYDLDAVPDHWKPLRIDFSPGVADQVEVYDWQRGEWVKATRLSDRSPDHLSAFISPFDRVVVRMNQRGPYPAIEVEGRVVR